MKEWCDRVHSCILSATSHAHEELVRKRWFGMAEVRSCLVDMRARHPELKDLTLLCGEHPEREPPTEEVLHEVRCAVADGLGVARSDVEASHPASSWRFKKGSKVERGIQTWQWVTG